MMILAIQIELVSKKILSETIVAFKNENIFCFASGKKIYKKIISLILMLLDQIKFFHLEIIC